MGGRSRYLGHASGIWQVVHGVKLRTRTHPACKYWRSNCISIIAWFGSNRLVSIGVLSSPKLPLSFLRSSHATKGDKRLKRHVAIETLLEIEQNCTLS